MAVTIHSSPQKYTPTDNPCIWVFSSDETAQDNFSYIIELYINSVLVGRYLKFPENGIYAQFDASEIILTYANPATVNTTAAVQDAANWLEVYIKVIERYGDPPANEDDATSSTIYPFKACLSIDEFNNFDYTDYMIDSVTAGLFLTDFDRNSFGIRESRTQFLQIINDEQSGKDLQVLYIDSSGATIHTQTFPIDSSIRIAHFTLNSDSYLSTSNFNDSYSLRVRVVDGAVKESESIDIVINREECGVISTVTWLNKFGSFDSFVFTHNLSEKADVQRFGFSRAIGQWSGSTFVLAALDAGQQDYFNVIKDGGEISSGWITQATQNSLVQLYDSPLKMIETGEQSYKSIVIRNSSYDLKQAEYEDQINEVVDFVFSVGRKSIRL